MRRHSFIAVVALAVVMTVDLSAADAPHRIGAADLAAHVAAIQPAPPAGFTVVSEEPFVVIGDETPEKVRERAVKTVRWAASLLRKEYFASDPDAIYDVWLFKDQESYERQVRTLFEEDPISRFGYCSSQRHALIMNIATGSGTLVHEMTHSFMHGNFPNCPPWFNEGLASLYEQCGERKGRIHGFRNWRLPILQKALKDRSAPDFPTLTGYGDQDFYHHDSGVNYAVARYLCYYLQERDLLQPFYRAFVAAQENDPTGYGTLVRTLGSPDMTTFRASWEAFVIALLVEDP